MPSDEELARFMDPAIDERLEQLAQARFGTAQREKLVSVMRIQPPHYHLITIAPFVMPTARQIGATGTLPRLWLRPFPNKQGYYQALWGFHWSFAAPQVDLTRVACAVVEADDWRCWEFAQLEVLQRLFLHPLDEAQRMDELREACGYSIRTLADCIGVKKGYIENRLALLQLTDDLLELVQERPDTLIAAKYLATIADPAERKALIDAVSQHTLSVADLRRRLREEGSDDGDERAGEPIAGQPTEVATVATASVCTSDDPLPADVAAEVSTVEAILSRWAALPASARAQLGLDGVIATTAGALAQLEARR